MSNVILTNIMKVRDYTSRPLSLPILASYVEHHTEAKAEIFDVTNQMVKRNSYRKALQDLEKKLDNCEVLGVHTITPNYYMVLTMIAHLKRLHKDDLPTVVLGGPHATAMPEQILRETKKKGWVDVVVIGPGEKQLADIVNGTPLEDVPNIAYKDGNRIKLSKRKVMEPFNEKIEKKFLKACLIHSRESATRNAKGWELSDTSRLQCPNACDYCSCVNKGKPFGRNPGIVAEEIAEINDEKKLKNIIFVDDNHFLDFKYTKTLDSALKEQGIEASKTGYADLATLSKSHLSDITKMNYRSLFVGRDFVTNRLARIYGRRLAGRIRDVESEKKILDRAARTIPLTISYIIPAPHYTAEDVQQTVKDMFDYAWQHVRYGPLAPLPGTKIREKLKEEGLLLPSANNWALHNGRPADMTFKFIDKRVKNWANYNLIEEIKFHYYLDSTKARFPLDHTILFVAAVSTFENDDLDSCLKVFSKMFHGKYDAVIKDYIKTAPSYNEKNKQFVKYGKVAMQYML